MPKVPAIIPIADFRQDAARTLHQLRKSLAPVVITHRGQAAAVMQSVEAYEQGERGRQLLHLLAAGEHEFALGKGRTLDAVLADADRLIRDAAV